MMTLQPCTTCVYKSFFYLMLPFLSWNKKYKENLSFKSLQTYQKKKKKFKSSLTILGCQLDQEREKTKSKEYIHISCQKG